jgi:hypothetical protein
VPTAQIAVDLRSQFGPVRDQGARPTCLAFAASDTHGGLRAGWDPLSCEFAFFHAQRRAGRSSSQGAVLPAILDVLKNEGQPIEASWPYLQVVPADPALWKPPTAVGPCFGRNGISSGSDLLGVRSALALSRPIVMLTMLSSSFFMPTDGVVDPQSGEQPEPSQRHAVIAVGYGEVDSMPAILVRNSWGASWGIDGHAWLTDNFLVPRLFATATLLEEVDVPSRAIAA